MVKSIYSRSRAVTVRDVQSQKLLHELGLPLPEVVPDPAFTLHIEEPASAEREKYLVLSLRNWHKDLPTGFHRSFANFIGKTYQKYGLKTVLVPFSAHPENDTGMLEGIFSYLKDKSAVEMFEFSDDCNKVIGLISKAKAVIGMRLHSLIFATMTTTPFLAISYSRKVESFADGLEMGDYCIPLQLVTEEILDDRFSSLMNGYSAVKDKLLEKDLINRASALLNAEMLKLFLNSL